MSTVYSPKIVTDSLSLCLDVGNTKSYPGSGTTWTDLVGGLTFTSTGTTTPVEVIGGAKGWFYQYPGWQMAGSVAIMMIYNKVLTQSESLLNYNTMKRRFGR